MADTPSLLADEGSRANAVGLVANLGLAIVKLFVATMAGSTALWADGINSAGDVVATTIGWVGYRLARRPADDNHHFGHGKLDAVAGLIIGGLLLATGVFVVIDGVRVLVDGPREPPELIVAAVAVGTAVVKEALFRYVTAVGHRMRSPALLASARDHRSDVNIAGAVLASVIAARIGAPWLDPLAAVAIGLSICWMAWAPIRENAGVLTDEVDPTLGDAVRAAACAVPEVVRASEIRVHPMGTHHVAELEIFVSGDRSLREAHAIARRVEVAVIDAIDDIDRVVVHVSPTG